MNFNFSFCFDSVSLNKYITSKDFSAIIFSIKPYTDYVYLHVLGEPLLHPQLAEILEICDKNDIKVNLTPNGSLINKNLELLKSSNIRQFNISLHGIEENLEILKRDRYYEDVFNFAKIKSKDSYFSFRLWNKGINECSEFTKNCIERINSFFNINLNFVSI